MYNLVECDRQMAELMRMGMDFVKKSLRKEDERRPSTQGLTEVEYSVVDLLEETIDEGNLAILKTSATVADFRTFLQAAAFRGKNLMLRFLASDGGCWMHLPEDSLIPRFPGRAQVLLLPVPLIPINPSGAPEKAPVVASKYLSVSEKVALASEALQGRMAAEEQGKAAKAAVQATLSAEMDRWAFTEEGSSKLRDVRSLLASVDTVIWKDAQWTAVSTSELMMSDAAVKKAWRRAILICHPDRHQDQDAERQYRSDRIFAAINEAFKVYSQQQQ